VGNNVHVAGETRRTKGNGDMNIVLIIFCFILGKEIATLTAIAGAQFSIAFDELDIARRIWSRDKEFRIFLFIQRARRGSETRIAHTIR
jgi:hypothetical protein